MPRTPITSSIPCYRPPTPNPLLPIPFLLCGYPKSYNLPIHSISNSWHPTENVKKLREGKKNLRCCWAPPIPSQSFCRTFSQTKIFFSLPLSEAAGTNIANGRHYQLISKLDSTAALWRRMVGGCVRDEISAASLPVAILRRTRTTGSHEMSVCDQGRNASPGARRGVVLQIWSEERGGGVDWSSVFLLHRSLRS